MTWTTFEEKDPQQRVLKLYKSLKEVSLSHVISQVVDNLNPLICPGYFVTAKTLYTGTPSIDTPALFEYLNKQFVACSLATELEGISPFNFDGDLDEKHATLLYLHNTLDLFCEHFPEWKKSILEFIPPAQNFVNELETVWELVWNLPHADFHIQTNKKKIVAKFIFSLKSSGFHSVKDFVGVNSYNAWKRNFKEYSDNQPKQPLQ